MNIKILLTFLLLNILMVLGQEIPSPRGYVNDFANIIDNNVEIQLEQKLSEYYVNTQVQLAIVTITNLDGYSIEEYTNTLANKWKVGNKNTDSGIVVLISFEDHKWRIEVGYGLEGFITDATAYGIGKQCLTANFKEEQYTKGIDECVNAIMTTLGTMTQADREIFLAQEKVLEQERKENAITVMYFVLAIIFIILIIVAIVKIYKAYRTQNAEIKLFNADKVKLRVDIRDLTDTITLYINSDKCSTHTKFDDWEDFKSELESNQIVLLHIMNDINNIKINKNIFGFITNTKHVDYLSELCTNVNNMYMEYYNSLSRFNSYYVSYTSVDNLKLELASVLRDDVINDNMKLMGYLKKSFDTSIWCGIRTNICNGIDSTDVWLSNIDIYKTNILKEIDACVNLCNSKKLNGRNITKNVAACMQSITELAGLINYPTKLNTYATIMSTTVDKFINNIDSKLKMTKHQLSDVDVTMNTRKLFDSVVTKVNNFKNKLDSLLLKEKDDVITKIYADLEAINRSYQNDKNNAESKRRRKREDEERARRRRNSYSSSSSSSSSFGGFGGGSFGGGGASGSW